MNVPVMVGTAVVMSLLVLVAIFVAAWQARHVEGPTELLPEIFIDADDEGVIAEAAELLTEHGFEVLTPDPVVKHFDEAERLLRGECDPDLAALFQRAVLKPYEDELSSWSTRRLLSQIERLDN